MIKLQQQYGRSFVCRYGFRPVDLDIFFRSTLEPVLLQSTQDEPNLSWGNCQVFHLTAGKERTLRARLMSTRTSCRSFAVVLVVNAFIWNRSSAFFMLTSLSARNNFSRNLCAEARAVGCWCLAARIRGAPSRSAAGRATDSNFIPTVKGWVMSSASSSTVALQNQVKGAKR